MGINEQLELLLLGKNIEGAISAYEQVLKDLTDKDYYRDGAILAYKIILSDLQEKIKEIENKLKKE